jgi:hypothetical protein
MSSYLYFLFVDLGFFFFFLVLEYCFYLIGSETALFRKLSTFKCFNQHTILARLVFFCKYIFIFSCESNTLYCKVGGKIKERPPGFKLKQPMSQLKII